MHGMKLHTQRRLPRHKLVEGAGFIIDSHALNVGEHDFNPSEHWTYRLTLLPSQQQHDALRPACALS